MSDNIKISGGLSSTKSTESSNLHRLKKLLLEAKPNSPGYERLVKNAYAAYKQLKNTNRTGEPLEKEEWLKTVLVPKPTGSNETENTDSNVTENTDSNVTENTDSKEPGLVDTGLDETNPEAQGGKRRKKQRRTKKKSRKAKKAKKAKKKTKRSRK